MINLWPVMYKFLFLLEMDFYQNIRLINKHIHRTDFIKTHRYGYWGKYRDIYNARARSLARNEDKPLPSPSRRPVLEEQL